MDNSWKSVKKEVNSPKIYPKMDVYLQKIVEETPMEYQGEQLPPMPEYNPWALQD